MAGAMKTAVERFRREVAMYRVVLADPRTPRLAKVLLGLAVAYVITPLDIIPDFVPVLGQIDDIIIVSLLVYVALRCVPHTLVEEHRRNAGIVQSPSNNGGR